MVQQDALACQQDVEPPVAEPPSLRGPQMESGADRAVGRPLRGIPVGLRFQPDQPARSPLRIALLLNRPGHGYTPLAGRQKFFASISFSVATSSICSANSFFSLAFSSSSPFSLRASD